MYCYSVDSIKLTVSIKRTVFNSNFKKSLFKILYIKEKKSLKS